MRDEVILITGANGEIGHSLIIKLGKEVDIRIVALDLKPLDESLIPYCKKFIQGDILDQVLLGNLFAEYDITTIFHLASILSTKSEYNPLAAHKINVEGTINLLRFGMELSQNQGYSLKFIYPSSIAVYGLPNLKIKNKEGKIKENQWCNPITIYGCNKLYCEHLGEYYANHYRQLARNRAKNNIDFRCIRFPGLISANTIPSGGTSDYGPEMLHNIAKGKPYTCFVRPSTRLPFMTMPDAIKALLLLEGAQKSSLTQLVYNVTSFSPTAQDLFNIIRKAYPNAKIDFEVDPSRQAIVDSWPADIDDSAAQNDWAWKPDYPIKRAFNDYLIPAIKTRYSNIKSQW